MKVGTKSLLFGAHAFWMHPFFVAYAWIKLYGFPFDLRIWFAFFLHDVGYWGKCDMDGPSGKSHIHLGGQIMDWLFGKEWGDFCRRHSRSYCREVGEPVSRLCYADKMVPYYQPWWLYIPMTWLTGELEEYMHRAKTADVPEYVEMNCRSNNPRVWYKALQTYLSNWAKTNMEEPPKYFRQAA